MFITIVSVDSFSIKNINPSFFLKNPWIQLYKKFNMKQVDPNYNSQIINLNDNQTISLDWLDHDAETNHSILIYPGIFGESKHHYNQCNLFHQELNVDVGIVNRRGHVEPIVSPYLNPIGDVEDFKSVIDTIDGSITIVANSAGCTPVLQYLEKYDNGAITNVYCISGGFNIMKSFKSMPMIVNWYFSHRIRNLYYKRLRRLFPFQRKNPRYKEMKDFMNKNSVPEPIRSTILKQMRYIRPDTDFECSIDNDYNITFVNSYDDMVFPYSYIKESIANSTSDFITIKDKKSTQLIIYQHGKHRFIITQWGGHLSFFEKWSDSTSWVDRFIINDLRSIL